MQTKSDTFFVFFLKKMKRSLELNPKDEAGLNGEFKNLGPKPEALPGIF